MIPGDSGVRRRAMTLAAFGSVIALSGCGPSPTRTALTLTAATGLNPNQASQPSPLVVRVYELKSVDTFNQLPFFDLFDQDVAKLGGDLLNRREVEIQPGATLEWQRNADPGARYIGAIAGYRELANITWRDSVQLRQESRNTISLRLDAHSMTVTLVPPSRFLGIF
jgi:type VI secretion system protein VasD